MDVPPLYAILDTGAVAQRGWAPADVCRAWLSAGVRLIQLRAKLLPAGAFQTLADDIVRLCHESGATLIINDRADIAVLSGADGVHVGQEDITAADARLCLGPAAIVGLSTHDIAQLSSAVREPISYVAFGPVFSTTTKETGYGELGLDVVKLAAVVTRSEGVPLVTIGGLTLDRAPAVREAGADSLAVITDLLVATDLAGVELRARTWLETLK